MCNDMRKNRDLRANVDVLESCEQADIEMKLTAWKSGTGVFRKNRIRLFIGKMCQTRREKKAWCINKKFGTYREIRRCAKSHVRHDRAKMKAIMKENCFKDRGFKKTKIRRKNIREK